MGKVLVLVGAGHAHLHTLANLRVLTRRGHSVFVVSPVPFHYYSGMGPGMLAGTYAPGEVRFNVAAMSRDGGAQFIPARVVGLDAQRKVLELDSAPSLDYDLVSFNVGSFVAGREGERPSDSRVFPVKPIENLHLVRGVLMNWPGGSGPRVVVVGGGPAGVEVAANAMSLLRTLGGRGGVTLVAGATLLPSVPARVRGLSRRMLDRLGVRVLEGRRGRSIQQGWVDLEDGERLGYDVALLATGVHAARILEDSGVALTGDGAMKIGSNLRSTSHPDILGGGDGVVVEGYALKRVGVHAVKQGPVLFHNLRALLNGGSLRSYDPPGEYLQIMNMGEGRAIAWKYGIAVAGRLPFLLKDRIDRRFMRAYQRSGERDEPT